MPNGSGDCSGYLARSSAAAGPRCTRPLAKGSQMTTGLPSLLLDTPRDQRRPSVPFAGVKLLLASNSNS